MKFRDLIKRIEDDGWAVNRQRGSHRVYNHANKDSTVVVAGKPGKDVPPGTLGAILKQAGLK